MALTDMKYLQYYVIIKQMLEDLLEDLYKNNSYEVLKRTSGTVE